MVMERDKENGRVPNTFKQMMDYLILKDCQNVMGIFRLSGISDEITDFRHQLDFGEKVDFKEASDIHIGILTILLKFLVSSLLKLYLKLMPEPVIPFDLYDEFMIAQSFETNEMIDAFVDLLKKLSPIRKNMLIDLIDLMDKIQLNSSENKMTKENLSIVIGVNILRSKDPNPLIMLRDTSKVSNVFYSLIENHSAWRNLI
jgi:hypothetical protein